MNFKIEDQKIKIKKNELNKFWKPKGIFTNLCFININNKWHTCVIKIKNVGSKKHIQIINPSLIDAETSQVIKVYYKGVYFESEISKIKSSIIEYLIGLDIINYSIYQLKNKIHRNSLNMFLILLTLIYTALNYIFDNIISEKLSRNILFQAISFLSFLCFFKVNKRKNLTNFNKKEYLIFREEEKADLESEREASI